MQDTFDMDDTLFMVIDIPKTLIDKQADIENTFENFDFRIETKGRRYDVFNEYTTDLFNLNTEVGADSILAFSSFNLFRLIPDFDGTEYHYKGFFTFKQSGIFAMNVYCYSDEDIEPFEFNGNCDNRNVYFRCDVNEGHENNLQLIKPYLSGNPQNWESDFRKRGGYAFVVRE